MNDATRNTEKGNSPLNIDSFEVTKSILLLGVAATFGKSSMGRSTVTVENRCYRARLLAGHRRWRQEIERIIRWCNESGGICTGFGV